MNSPHLFKFSTCVIQTEINYSHWKSRKLLANYQMLVQCNENTLHLKLTAFFLTQAWLSLPVLCPPNASMNVIFLPALSHMITVISFQSFTNAKFTGQGQESTEACHIPEMSVVELNRDLVHRPRGIVVKAQARKQMVQQSWLSPVLISFRCQLDIAQSHLRSLHCEISQVRLAHGCVCEELS